MSQDPRPPSRLVDRRAETQRLDGLLTDSRRSGSALLLTGARGHGKTAVLQEAGTRAEAVGMRVVRVDVPDGQGVGDASGLAPLAAQLGRPALPLADPLDRLGAGNDLLSRLGAASAESPVLVCIDDADRLDEASASVLAFVGRRLATTRAALLATWTPGPSNLLRHRGLPELDLPAMSVPDSRELLATRAPDLVPQVCERVVADARGNPLALVELPSALTEQERLGLDPLPTVLPLTKRLRDVYGGVLDGLTPEAFELLVTVALIRPRDVDGSVSRRSGEADTGILGLVQKPAEALHELETRGLIEVRPEAPPIRFVAPLVRNAVVDRASSGQVRAAHLRLASALGDRADRRTWHLAAATIGVDETMAEEVEQLAQRARRAGDLREAVDSYRRAAELSPTSRERSARLSAAAQLQVSLAGDLRSATRLLADASRAAAESPEDPGSTTARAQLLLVQGGHTADVRRVLVDALDRWSPDSGDVREWPGVADALQLLFYVCLLEARAEPWLAYDRLVQRHQERRGPVLGMLDAILPDLTRATPASVASLEAAITRVTGSAADPGEAILVGIVALHLDRLADCRATLARIIEESVQGPAKFLGVQARLRLSLDDCMTGQFAHATRLAEDAMAMSISLDHDQQLWPFQLCLALVAAMRGDRPGVESLTESMAGWAVPRGALLVEHHCAHVRCLAALGEEDFETAYQHAASINPPGTLAAYTTVAVWACLDLVEAALGSGRHEEAHAHADAIVRSGIAELSPRLAQRVAAAVAMTASDQRAPELFEKALAVEHVERWPFETARLELAYGERLRRLHDPLAAQEHLRRAYETFRRLDARPWTMRAADQLRATGSPVPDRRRTRPTLSGRDLEIATLAASGLSNREIGERLYLSPRTIGSRLYRIFPKLGVASRAALRDALEQAATEDAGVEDDATDS